MSLEELRAKREQDAIEYHAKRKVFLQWCAEHQFRDLKMCEIKWRLEEQVFTEPAS